MKPVLSLRADLEEAPPAPAPMEAPQQSVDEVETNMLQDFTQRMAAGGTESNVRDAAQEYVDSVKSNVQVEQSGPSIVYVAGQAALLLLMLVRILPCFAAYQIPENIWSNPVVMAGCSVSRGNWSVSSRPTPHQPMPRGCSPRRSMKLASPFGSIDLRSD